MEKTFQKLENIIKIEPAINLFSITWQIHRKCNYDCMYCPPREHDNTSKTKSLEELKTIWQKIYNETKKVGLRYKISFTGGEATINKNFKPFIKWLKENYKNDIHELGLTTNGSANDRYYLDLFNELNWMTFSTHTEHMNVEKFFITAKRCSNFAKINNKSFHVNIMKEFWAGELINNFKSICKENNINHSINDIDYNLKTREIPIFKNKIKTNV
jgi:organic radical activating enzyme